VLDFQRCLFNNGSSIADRMSARLPAASLAGAPRCSLMQVQRVWRRLVPDLGWVASENEATNTGSFRVVCSKITQGCGILPVGHSKFSHEGSALSVVLILSVVIVAVVKG
jgi:hypothetical protein